MTLDRDLQSIQEVRDLVANAKKAQRELAEFSQEKIDRINELARKAKTDGLTVEEEPEREALRLEYKEAILGSLRDHLEHTWIVDEKGNKRKLQHKGEKAQ